MTAEELLVAPQRGHLLPADDAHPIRPLELLGRRVGETVQTSGDLRIDGGGWVGGQQGGDLSLCNMHFV